jgi:hypothetical protein
MKGCSIVEVATGSSDNQSPSVGALYSVRN